MMALSSIARDLDYGGVLSRDRQAASHIPYMRHIADDVIKTKDSEYLTFIRLDGYSFQTADNAHINQRYMARNTLLRSLSSSHWGLYSHIIRRRIDPAIKGTFTNPFCQLLNERYLGTLKERSLFTNEMVFTVVRKNAVGKMGLLDTLFRGVQRAQALTDDVRTEREAVAELRELTTNFVEQFQSYGARQLRVTQRPNGLHSEPLEFLQQLVNGPSDVPVQLPRMGIDRMLTRKRPVFERRTLVLHGAHERDSWFGAMLSVKEYPPHAGPGMLDQLLSVNHAFIVSQSFAVIERATAREQINTIENQVEQADEGGTIVGEQITEARDAILGSLASLGEHHLTVLCLGRTPAELNKAINEIGAVITDMGMVPVREDLNMEPAFWAQLPANFGYVARRAKIMSTNFCAFSSFHNFPSGQTRGLHWGSPIALLETTSSTPYTFNFHVNDVGNFLVIGPTGSGKTVALSFLAAQAQRVTPTPRLVFFDRDRGAEILIRALGGNYEILQPGTPTGFNPFQIGNTPQNREFLFTLVSYMCLPAGAENLDAQEEGIIRDAIGALMRYEPEQRQAFHLLELLRGRTKAKAGDLAARFDDWVRPEQRGWLFANAEDRLAMGGAANGTKGSGAGAVLGFDMTQVLNDPKIRTAALLYIFHRIDSLIDGTPLMLFLDEGWKLLDDPVFLTFIREKLKTIRKLNGIVGFGTQSAADIVRSSAANTLIEQTATTLFFPNAKADAYSHREVFKLSEREFQWVQTTPVEARSFLIKHASDSVIARLDLKAAPDLIKVLSARTSTLQEMDALITAHGPDPEQWLPHFMAMEPVEDDESVDQQKTAAPPDQDPVNGMAGPADVRGTP
jgi:type IV secretion system protein VirB4